ncbi:MAG: aminotransferase class I/II-fold pyridoxal phosphate-dependent enzyme [Deltaproteobacteria bacterium]|nr:aminotransferase class I/II-fold pyridoxal phosphate-dependent enzyme [Deltaproteobacteria bacterium]
MTTLADRTLPIKPSVTLAIAAKAGKLRSEGVDVVNFSAGEPDFDTPERIKAAAVEALKRGMTKYTDVKGIEPLRKAIAEKYQREYGLAYRKDEVLVSCGAKHSLYNLFQAAVNPGDEVLIPAPYWVSYSDMALLAGGVPKIIQTTEATDFRIRAQQLADTLSPRTRVFVLNSPCNPTGASYDKDELLAIAKVIDKHKCLIIADDIYEKIVYDAFQVHNLVQLSPSLRDRTIIVNGVSKTYAMTGWRIGYALGSEDIISAAAKIQSQSTSNPTSIAQAAALEAIGGPQDDVAMMVGEFQKRRNVIVERLNAIDGIHCLKPQGAFYVFPNISAFIGKTANRKKLGSPCDVADYLLEEAKVAAVPGEDFGSKAHIRLSYATSRENIEEGCRRMRDALGKIR